MPTTPTRSVGWMPNCTIGLNTVMPPQNSGPALVASLVALVAVFGLKLGMVTVLAGSAALGKDA